MPQFLPPLSADEIQEAFPGRFVSADSVFAGGQGAVFKCRTSAGGFVAMKVYVPDPGAHVEERTHREVAALATMNCPSIVRLQDHGNANIRGGAVRYVATTFIEGKPLNVLLQDGPLGVAIIAQIGHDIAVAIDAIWDPHRIVHRDIKPPNVMWTTAGRAILIDLGIARHTALDTLTMTGGVCGTWGYMSPEQARGSRHLSCKSDVFALGILLQACLLARHPTGGDQRPLVTDPPRTSVLVPELRLDVSGTIDNMLRVRHVDRPLPATVAAFFRRLLETVPQ